MSRPTVSDLQTPCFRWTGHVKKGRAGVVYALEAFGPQTDKEIAERLGWSRARDLRRRYLDPLEARGLIERTGDRYAVPDAEAYRQVVEAVRSAPVERKVWRTSVEGRALSMVVDGASEHEREASDRAKHEEQRREREEERRRYRSRFRAVPGREPDWESVQEKPPDGEIRELGRVEVTDAELVEALAAYLNRNPHRSSETPSWLAVALWAEEYLPGKPAPAEVEVALASPELRAVAA